MTRSARVRPDQARAGAYFADARAYCRRLALTNGESPDYYETWTDHVDVARMSPADFLADYAWVVYASGFRVSILETKWEALQAAWHEFDPDKVNERTKVAALQVFGHIKKAEAIAHTAALLRRMSYDAFRGTYLADTESIGQLPFMGPVVRYHLARNLAVDLNHAKPDVHLRRAAEQFGYGDSAEGAQRLCEDLSRTSGLRAGVVDLILWEYLRSGAKERPQAPSQPGIPRRTFRLPRRAR